MLLDVVKYLFIFSSYVFYVYYRKLFFLLSNQIKDDVEFSTEQYGTAISINSFCYMISKLIVGSLNDVYHPKNVLVGSLLVICLSTLTMSQSNSIFEFYLCIALNALCQGGGWTAIIKLLKMHYPNEIFPMLFSFLACTNNVAGFVLPFTILTGWRHLMVYAGTVGVIFCSVLYGLLSGQAKFEEPKTSKNKLQMSDFKFIFKSTPIWVTGIMLGFAMEIRTISESWVPLFLKDHQSDFDLSSYWLTFEVGGFVGSLVSGALVQFLYKFLSKERSRFAVANLSTFLLLVFCAGIFYAPDHYNILAFLVGFNVYASINVWGIISAEIASSQIAATANSVVAFISNSSSILAGSPVAFIISYYGFDALIPVISAQILVFFVILVRSYDISLYIEKYKNE